MTSFHPTPNVAFTSQEHWNAEPETSAKVPKNLADQVAKTDVGRVMQISAEERILEADKNVEADFNRVDFSGVNPNHERDQIALLIEQGKLTIEEDGTPDLSEEMSSNELSDIRELLLGLKLPSDDPEARRLLHEKVNDLLCKIQAKITPQAAKTVAKEESKPEITVKQEVERAKESFTKSLERLECTQSDITMAIRTKRWNALNTLNQQVVLAALEMLDALEKLRDVDPDSLVDLAYEHGSFDNPREATGSIIVQFAKTHNSFSFSQAAEKELAMVRIRDFNDGNRDSFAGNLLSAYNTIKKEDDTIEFLRKTTRIPQKRFDQIIEEALAA